MRAVLLSDGFRAQMNCVLFYYFIMVPSAHK